VRLDHLLSKEFSSSWFTDTCFVPGRGHPVDALAGIQITDRALTSSAGLDARPVFRCEGVRPSSRFGSWSGPSRDESLTVGALLENFIAITSIFVCVKSQATKGQRWMPWRPEPMKDVGGCEKLRVGAYQPIIRRYPNGETQHS